MLRNELFKYKLIKYTLITHTPCALCLCTLLSALMTLSASVVHASSRCADIVSTSSDSSMKNDLGSSLTMNVLDFYSNFFNFSNSKTPIELTKGFQSYIGALLEHKIIGDPELIRFIENLEKGELINPISEDEARVSTPLLVQRRGLQQYLNKASLDQKELLAWSKVTLEKRDRVRVSREETREETRDISQELEFHPVKRPVRFKVEGGRYGTNNQFVTLTYPIEVQSTPVTQKQWVEVMGENPSDFAKGEESTFLNFHGKAIRLQPDNPVENVTWWSILVFANRLSENHGLQPVYDLSGITWEPGTGPENGTLKPALESNNGDGGFIYKNSDEKVRIYVKGKSHDASEGDIYYQAEGYRLPTHAEQIYMLRGGGKMKGGRFFENESDLAERVWYEGNSGRRTHPVGLLQPMVVDGKEFYDFYGNVGEFGWDQVFNAGGFQRSWHQVVDASDYLKKYGAKNPAILLSLEGSNGRWVTGGDYSYSQSNFSSSYALSAVYDSVQYHNVGFRLVRTINGEGVGK